MAVKIIAPGLSTTVQDLGRPGYYHLGIPISADGSVRLARSQYAGRYDEAAVLGVFMGPRLTTTAATVAVTGGEAPGQWR